MADTKISDLSAASALTGTELVEVVQGGSNVKTTAQDIADLGGGGGGLDARAISPIQMMIEGPSTAALFANTSNTDSDGTLANSPVSSTVPAYRKSTSAATANNNAGYIITAKMGAGLGWHLRLTVVLPDGSYGSGATGSRLAFGATQNSALSTYRASDSGFGTSRAAVFQYSTNRGDTNFQFITSGGASSGDSTVTDTGVAFAPGVWEAQMWMPHGAASCGWSLQRIDGSGGASGVVTTTLPNLSANGSGQAGVTLRTLSAVARVIGIADATVSIYNKGP